MLLTSAAEAEIVGWWKFDETTGTTARDASGNGHDGTLTGGPTWTAGKIGGALDFEFSNTNECVVIPPFEVIGGGITLSAWVKPESFSQADARIIDKGTDVAAANDAWWMLSPVSSGGQIRLRFRLKTTESATTTTQIATSGNLSIDEWAHTAAIWDGTSMILYQDGVEVGRVTKGGNAVATNPNARVYIGNQLGGTQRRPFDGLIDDVRVYNAALTQQQLQVLMEGSEGYPFAFGPEPADGALHENTWVNLRWSPGDFAVSHDVYFGENLDDVNAGAAETFRGNQVSTTMFIGLGLPGDPYPDGLVPGTTYYWRIDEVNEADPNSPWKGNVWSFLIPPNTAYNPNPADGAQFIGPDNVTLAWTPGFGVRLHTVFIGTSYDEVADATTGAQVGSPAYNAGKLELEKVYYWRVDEFDGVETHKGDIWAFTTPGAVGNPQPANGAVDVPMDTMLTWTAADSATSHELYFGTDAEAVENATTASPEYVGPRALGAVSYDPGGLEWGGSYAWRVDEVYPTGTVKGLVWTFTTADFIVVDDFESYDDIDPLPGEPGVNRIFDKWIDGFGIATNGAITAEEFPPYAEQVVVHTGGQSMKYLYDTNFNICESILTLAQPAGSGQAYPTDWTEGGAGRLSLWFRGESANSAERMFVALNGTAVVYHDDPAATQTTGWTEWIIDLQAFADQGVNLTNVNTITIGFGTKNSPAAGGSGKMYIDDIRLRRSAAADSGVVGLVAQYSFENNVDDGSGNGHHGTLAGNPTYVESLAGYGMALDFEFGNTEDCVVAPPFDVVAGGITLSAWVKPESFSQADGRIIDKGTNVAAANDAWWMLSTVASGGQSRLRFRLKTDESATTTTQIATSGNMAAGEWSHAAATWDGTSMILFQDGVEVGRVNKGGNAVAANAEARVYIGNQLGGVQRRPWDGLIDEVRIYSRALSELEIRYLAQ